MAEYKVAQDVEAEDKLIGPFSFRQFIYLIVVAICIAMAWGLSQIFIALALIPLPFILLFGALALPLRKDQPMEIYLAAIVSYMLKPRKRVWEPDGVDSLIQITTPEVVDEHLTKELTQYETEKRLSYLANIADTEGWSIRHATAPVPNSSMNPDQYYAAQQTVDVMDDDGGVARKFDTMIAHADQDRRTQIMQNMRQTQPTSAPLPQSPSMPDDHSDIQNGRVSKFNPYPTIHQTVIQPRRTEDKQPPHNQINQPNTQNQNGVRQPNIGTNITSDAIMSIANNSGLSVETIQREVDKLKKNNDDSEIFVSLH